MQGLGDIDDDQSTGFELITTDEIDEAGVPDIVRRIRERVGNSPVYLRFVNDCSRGECC